MTKENLFRLLEPFPDDAEVFFAAGSSKGTEPDLPKGTIWRDEFGAIHVVGDAYLRDGTTYRPVIGILGCARKACREFLIAGPGAPSLLVFTGEPVQP